MTEDGEFQPLFAGVNLPMQPGGPQPGRGGRGRARRAAPADAPAAGAGRHPDPDGRRWDPWRRQQEQGNVDPDLQRRHPLQRVEFHLCERLDRARRPRRPDTRRPRQPDARRSGGGRPGHPTRRPGFRSGDGTRRPRFWSSGAWWNDPDLPATGARRTRVRCTRVRRSGERPLVLVGRTYPIANIAKIANIARGHGGSRVATAPSARFRFLFAVSRDAVKIAVSSPDPSASSGFTRLARSQTRESSRARTPIHRLPRRRH